MRPILLLVCAAGLAGCSGLGLDPDTDATTSSGSDPSTSTSTTTPPTTTFELECTPGQERCAGDDAREVCKATGLGWQAIPCTKYQTCSESGDPATAACLGPCETLTETSLGCEFLAIRMRSFNLNDDAEDVDAIFVGNTDEVNTAEVQLYILPEYFNVEEPVGGSVTLLPGERRKFILNNDPMPSYSSFRTGGVYHIVSDYPVSAYLHSPLKNLKSNDASVLLPVKALGTDYIVASYPPLVDNVPPDLRAGRPSYFNIIATENDTQVEWIPPTYTAGNGINVYTTAPGETGTALLQRFDVLQIGASSTIPGDPDETPIPDAEQDVSGTIIHATKPIVVMGATSCAGVPVGTITSCNHLQEQLLPKKYWGKTYIAPHAPTRGPDTSYHWRVYGTRAGQQIILSPPPIGLGSSIQLGQLGSFAAFKDVAIVGDQPVKSFTFKSTEPFMAVQYLTSGQELAVPSGDPSMYQTIPVEQHLKRYVFVTGDGYVVNYAQVIRKFGGASVFINDVEVGVSEDDKWYLINTTGNPPIQYEVSDFVLDPADDVYLAESADPFGINVMGYADNSAYAYPGGMALKVINPDGGN